MGDTKPSLWLFGIFAISLPGKSRVTAFSNGWLSRHVLAAVLILTAVLTTGAEERFPILQAGGKFYTNVVVMNKTETHVFISHAQGMTSLKVEELDDATRAQLGYAPPPPPEPVKTPELAPEPEPAVPPETEYKPMINIHIPPQIKSFITSPTGAGVLAGVFVFYLFFCRSCWNLCRRAGSPSRILVWLPGLKWLALFKAVGMSRWWFSLGLLFPLILIGLCVALQANWYSLWLFFSLMLLVSWFVCCWRLCEAFHRSKLLVFPMILPFLGWPVFMYLSWISRADDDAPAIRDQDRFLFS